MRLATLLLLIVALTHYGADPLAEMLGWRSTALFYALRGIEGAALFAVIALQRFSIVLLLVAGWGFVEEAQTAICRLSQDMTTAPSAAPYAGLCGSWAYYIGVVVLAALAAFVAREKTK